MSYVRHKINLVPGVSEGSDFPLTSILSTQERRCGRSLTYLYPQHPKKNMTDQLSLRQQSTATPTTTTEKMLPTVSAHKERHTGHGDLIRDSIIGFSDGLTVPFALTAGLSSLGSSRIVIVGGLAELFAGAISMGLGAFLAALTEKKHYEVEEAREREEVKKSPHAEEDEIYEIFEQYGIQRNESKGVVEGLKANEEQWVRVC